MKQAILAAAVLLQFAGQAGAEVFKCDIEQFSVNGSYLAPVVAVTVSGDGETAEVSDEIILFFQDRPIKAKITANNDARLTVAWKLKIKNQYNQYLKANYRLTIQRGSKKADLRSSFDYPYEGDFYAPGTCKLVK